MRIVFLWTRYTFNCRDYFKPWEGKRKGKDSDFSSVKRKEFFNFQKTLIHYRKQDKKYILIFSQK